MAAERGVRPVVGRFAPSPTGPLHAGSLVAALASWLDVRAAGGRWLVRIEDADRARCLPGMGELILSQLACCGLLPDAPPWWQSQRDTAYASALQQLVDAGRAYPCACTRREIEGAWAARGLVPVRDAERIYPGTCRAGLAGRPARAWRLRVPPGVIRCVDRRLGAQQQDVGATVGDFVLKRADGLWAYQLAVVVDDADQGVTDVVRGEDLADNTARQILLQQALGRATPRYLHTPLVLAADGHKLSKQNGAAALDLHDPMAAVATVAAALRVLDLSVLPGQDLPDLLARAVAEWGHRWPLAAAGDNPRHEPIPPEENP